MDTIAELERKVLELPRSERERLALRAWESLLDDPDAASDETIDPQGVQLAIERDVELQEGNVSPIGSKEFRRRTGGAG